MMYKFDITLQGTCPVFFNQWTRSAIASLEGTGGRGGKQTIDDKIAEAPEKAYQDPITGMYYIPGNMLKASIVNGAKMANLKVLRRGLATYLKAVMFVHNASLGVSEIPYLDRRVIPTSSGADIQVRPAFGRYNYINDDGDLMPDEPWEASTTVFIGDDAIDVTDVKKAIDTAGLYSAVGSHRPDYGRFRMVSSSALTKIQSDELVA